MRNTRFLFSIAMLAMFGGSAVHAQKKTITVGPRLDLNLAQVSLRYDLGLANINGDGEAVAKNRAFSVAVGYGFRIGH